MTRLHRLLRLARLRGDLAAIAILTADRRWTPDSETPMMKLRWTEAELREAWGK